MDEVFIGIGNIYYDMGDFQKALLQYEKGLALAKEISVKMLMAYNYSAMGYAHYSLKNWDVVVGIHGFDPGCCYTN